MKTKVLPENSLLEVIPANPSTQDNVLQSLTIQNECFTNSVENKALIIHNDDVVETLLPVPISRLQPKNLRQNPKQTPVAILSKQQAIELKDLDKKVFKLGKIKMSLNQSIKNFGAQPKEAAALEIMQILKKGLFEYVKNLLENALFNRILLLLKRLILQEIY